MATLLTLYKEQLGAPGSIRNMAALLLGRLLTRPDQEAALHDFVQWAGGVLASSSIQNVFILPGEVPQVLMVWAVSSSIILLPLLH